MHGRSLACVVSVCVCVRGVLCTHGRSLACVPLCGGGAVVLTVPRSIFFGGWSPNLEERQKIDCKKYPQLPETKAMSKLFKSASADEQLEIRALWPWGGLTVVTVVGEVPHDNVLVIKVMVWNEGGND